MTQSSYSSSSGLKAWIMAQIGGGMYPGLEWEDEEKTTFRIPWKHAGRQRHCNDVDSAIFKAWTVHRGKYREGMDKPDPSTWKARLRCALNKSPHFQELKELSQAHIAESYKVYRILAMGAHEKDEDSFSDARERRHLLLTPAYPPNAMVSEASIDHFATDEYTCGMELVCFYKSMTVCMWQALHTNGCRISSSVLDIHDESIFGPRDILQFNFPSTEQISDHQQRLHTEMILKHLERGLLLLMTMNGLYAYRLCMARVFWTGPCTEDPNNPNKMERNVWVKLFDCRQFMHELKLYMQGLGRAPRFHVTLCFGEKLTDKCIHAQHVTVQDMGQLVLRHSLKLRYGRAAVQVEPQFAKRMYEEALLTMYPSCSYIEISPQNPSDELSIILKMLLQNINTCD